MRPGKGRCLIVATPREQDACPGAVRRDEIDAALADLGDGGAVRRPDAEARERPRRARHELAAALPSLPTASSSPEQHTPTTRRVPEGAHDGLPSFDA